MENKDRPYMTQEQELWILVFVVMLILIGASKVHCGVKDYAKYPFKLTWKIASNKHVQKWGSSALWISSRYFDAKADACIFGKGKMYYGSPERWHAYKNTSLICTIGAFTLKGLGLGQNNLKASDELKRFIFGEMLISWLVWQNGYDLHRYNKICDYRPETNEHRYMIPFFGADRYIKTTPVAMGTIDLGLLGVGIYNLIKH